MFEMLQLWAAYILHFFFKYFNYGRLISSIFFLNISIMGGSSPPFFFNFNYGLLISSIFV